ncbi:hypothetical protein LTR27_006786 [Elasticomyces elasticus]|nr:hypothetical protein LTR27_006786 [Elasticomyces elasticus]
MSGFEIAGIIFGAWGFLRTAYEITKRYRKTRKSRATELPAKETRVVTTAMSASYSDAVQVGRSSLVDLQLDSGRTAQEQWKSLSALQQSNNDVVHAGINALERMGEGHRKSNEEVVRAGLNTVKVISDNYRSSNEEVVRAGLNIVKFMNDNHRRSNEEVVRAGVNIVRVISDNHRKENEAAWELVRTSFATYVETHQWLTFIIIAMMSCIVFLAYFLGVYTGEDATLRQWQWVYHSLDFAFDGLDTHGPKGSTVLFVRGAFSRFTLIPLRLPWLASSVTETVGSTAYTAINGAPLAAATHSAPTYALQLGCWPSSVVCDFIVMLLELCLVCIAFYFALKHGHELKHGR